MRIKALMLSLIFMISVLTGTCASEQKVEIAVVSGTARVIDGDTIAIGKYKIRLNHIDAPELNQNCTYKNTTIVYHCGIEARDALQLLLKGKVLSCYKDGFDIYNRILGRCFVSGININRFMISTGNAVLYKNKIYIREQEEAKQNLRGVWGSSFVEPWVWRKAQKIKAKAASAACASKATN